MGKLKVLACVACGMFGAAFCVWAAVHTGHSPMDTVVCAFMGGASLSVLPLALSREER